MQANMCIENWKVLNIITIDWKKAVLIQKFYALRILPYRLFLVLKQSDIISFPLYWYPMV